MNLLISIKKILIITVASFSLFLPYFAQAADPTTLGGGLDQAKSVATSNGLQILDFSLFIQNVIQFAFALVGIIAVAAIVWGGIMYMLSLGDEKKTETAKKIILSAIIGLLILGSSFFIVREVLQLFK